MGEPTTARRTEALAERVRRQHFVKLGVQLPQDHVGQPRADDGGDQPRHHVEIEAVGPDRSARYPALQESPQLLDPGFADGLVQPPDIFARRGIRGGRRQASQPRQLDEERHPPLDEGFEVRPELSGAPCGSHEIALVARSLVCDEPAVQVELVLEVLVEAALRDPGAPRNLRERRFRVSALGELRDRLTYEALAPLAGEGEEGARRHVTDQSYD